ncbi:ankyrin repeat family protein [Actinidia rufa]|uniref:Ankyrin repeat family protein n=1 Tax=Actinidia rufa TaxID=165716 RepID=A0A7J0GJT0_9ERIC|nr:ankyrin repeat family protein [Actinidia rufa]
MGLSSAPNPDLPMPSLSPRMAAPALVLSNSGKALASPNSGKTLFISNSGKRMDPWSSGGERDLEMGLSPSPRTAGPALVLSNSGKALAVSNSGKSLVISNSGKRMDPSSSGKRMDQQPNSARKKYVKQVTGRHNDTELHLAAQRGDVAAVKQILGEIDAQMVRTLSATEFDAEVAEIRSAIVNDVNELGETAMFTAAEKGHIDVVKELLPYTTHEGITAKNRSGFDPLHIAASQGHPAVVQILLDHDPGLCKNGWPIERIPSHICSYKRAYKRARQGHVDIVKALLDKDPQLARRTDKKGQTALHMAVKGISCEVVKLLLQADAAIVMLPDKFGNTALHVATRKKRSQKDFLCPEETAEIKDCLARYGAFRANELNQPRDELRKTVTEIKNDVHTQLEQARKTNKNMNGIAKELRKLHREGINNATNSVTVVAVLFATVAFAAIFTVPGGDDDNGEAVMVGSISFKVFFIFNAVALFTSLAVVLVQITVVRGEIKSERRVVEVINKLMWLASVCTTVAFIASSYIVVGRHHKWAAAFVTVVGAVTMAGVLGTMTYYVVKSKRTRKVRKREKFSRTGTNSFRHSDISESDVNPIYAI